MSTPTVIDMETARHRCEVRQILRWRVVHGSEWARDWLAGLDKSRGKETADRIRADVFEQWQRGNKGEHGDWR